MTLDVWQECRGDKYIKNINGTAWRIVELQEKTATRKLVDSIEEQKVLEELIEESKPEISKSHSNFHQLLYTPFRYPPLKDGSRFGKKTEQSLWYGSLNPETAMAEKAYYQLAFINASAGDFGTIISQMTIFSAKIKIQNGIELHKEPFLSYKDNISSPTSYEVSQFLGTQMRESNIDGFTFLSARSVKPSINVGLYKIDTFENKQPDAESFQTWQTNTTKNTVEFIRLGSIKEQYLIFPIKDFMVNDMFPFPSIV